MHDSVQRYGEMTSSPVDLRVLAKKCQLLNFPNEMRTFCKSQLHTISRLFSLRESLRSHAAMRQLSTVAHISTASEGFFSSPGSDPILITCVQQTEVTHRLPHQAEGSWLLIPKHFSQSQLLFHCQYLSTSASQNVTITIPSKTPQLEWPLFCSQTKA